MFSDFELIRKNINRSNRIKYNNRRKLKNIKNLSNMEQHRTCNINDEDLELLKNASVKYFTSLEYRENSELEKKLQLIKNANKKKRFTEQIN